jgi:hypothetical protein
MQGTLVLRGLKGMSPGLEVRQARKVPLQAIKARTLPRVEMLTLSPILTE